MRVGRVSTLAIISLCLSAPALAAVYKGTGSKPDTSFVVYIPDKLDAKQRHPWILGFSPDGNGQQTLTAMKQGCDDNGWILVASNNTRNGMGFNLSEPFVVDTIASAVRTLPVDPARMYVGGLSGGSMVAHWVVAKFPQQVKGLVVNCGMINRDLQKELSYPSGKDAVFMTNPQDFRYNEIRADFQFVTSHGWHTTWMEFPGGHQWAPPKYYSAAFKWLNHEASLHQGPSLAVKPKEQSLAGLQSLQSELAAAEKSKQPDQDKIAGLQEKVADIQAKNGKYAEAEEAYKKALEFGTKKSADSSGTALLMKKLAELYSAEGKNSDAAELLQKALSIQEKGTDKSAYAQTMQSYAKVLYKSGKTAEADALYARLKELEKK